MGKNYIANIVSSVLNAPFVCAYALIIYYSINPWSITYLSVLGSILFLFIIPWVPVLGYFVIFKKSPSKLSGRKRIPFVAIGLLSYILGTVYFYTLTVGGYAYEFFITLHLTYVFFSSLLILGNFKSKPSVHIGGFVAPVTLLALYVNSLFLLLLVLVPLIGWSRVKLGIHTINQLVLGFLIGLFSSIISYLIVESLLFL